MVRVLVLHNLGLRFQLRLALSQLLHLGLRFDGGRGRLGDNCWPGCTLQVIHSLVCSRGIETGVSASGCPLAMLLFLTRGGLGLLIARFHHAILVLL